MANADLEVEHKAMTPKYDLKDALVVTPFLASALAITWEVGFFLRIKGGSFGFFSITEHLTFAMEALPFAFVASISLLALIFSIELLDSYLAPRFRNMPASRRKATRRWIFLAGLTSSVVGLSLSFWHGHSVTMVILNGFLLFSFTGLAVADRKFRSPEVLSFILLLLAFCATLGLGVDLAGRLIFSDRPLSILVIDDKSNAGTTEIKARIIRTGDRGILYYTPSTRRFSLVARDAVKRAEWEVEALRSP